VPLDQGGEGGVVALPQEAAEELPVGQARAFPQEVGPAQVLDDLARLAGRRVAPSA
jgi:hypothetical protein